MRDAVRSRVCGAVALRPPAGGLKPTAPQRRLYLGLAWAAAVVIVTAIAFQRASGPRPQNTAATMASAPAELTVHPTGRDRFLVQSTVKGELDWDRTKLSKVEVLPDGTTILQRRKGASGTAFIRLSIGGREVLKTSIALDSPTF
jgi:hypothetical protein